MPALEKLGLEGLTITSAVGPALQTLPRLEDLSLMFSLDVGGDIVQWLDPDRVRVLKLPYRPMGSPIVTDETVQALAALSFRLRSLSVGGRGITPRAVDFLLELPDTLECLSLWHTRLSAADASLLRSGTGLSLDDSMRSTKGTFMLVP